MKELYIQRLSKRKYLIADETGTVICSIDACKKSLVECLVVKKAEEEWFRVKYKQTFIRPGFQAFEKSGEWKITGADSFLNGYTLKGTSIVLQDSDQYAYDFVCEDRKIACMSYQSMDSERQYTILVEDSAYLKDVIGISVGIVICNYMSV